MNLIIIFYLAHCLCSIFLFSRVCVALTLNLKCVHQGDNCDCFTFVHKHIMAVHYTLFKLFPKFIIIIIFQNRLQIYVYKIDASIIHSSTTFCIEMYIFAISSEQIHCCAAALCDCDIVFYTSHHFYFICHLLGNKHVDENVFLISQFGNAQTRTHKLFISMVCF